MHLDTTQTLTCSRRGRGIHLPVLTEGRDDIIRLGQIGRSPQVRAAAVGCAALKARHYSPHGLETLTQHQRQKVLQIFIEQLSQRSAGSGTHTLVVVDGATATDLLHDNE